MEVVVGTYNHVLFGFKLDRENADDDDETSQDWKLDPLFTDQGHAGCIKSVSAGGRYLASGSSDETIRLFDMKNHIEIGTVVQQSGTITTISFCGSSHMLSGSEDGTICIWKCKTWELEKTLKGHRGAVNSVTIHPSGRLALSVSKDKTIKTWNLLTGRPAYTTSLKEVGEIVRWSPKGDSYAIVVGCKVTVYKINGVDEPIVYRCDKYILAAEFLNEAVLILAGESDDILFYNFQKKLVLQRLSAHKVRTKAVSFENNPHKKDHWLLFTVASDGNLKVWSVNKKNLEEKPKLLAGIDLPGRPTCMTLKVPPPPPKMKKKSVKSVVSDVEAMKVEEEKEKEIKDVEIEEEEIEDEDNKDDASKDEEIMEEESKDEESEDEESKDGESKDGESEDEESEEEESKDEESKDDGCKYEVCTEEESKDEDTEEDISEDEESEDEESTDVKTMDTESNDGESDEEESEEEESTEVQEEKVEKISKKMKNPHNDRSTLKQNAKRRKKTVGD